MATFSYFAPALRTATRPRFAPREPLLELLLDPLFLDLVDLAGIDQHAAGLRGILEQQRGCLLRVEAEHRGQARSKHRRRPDQRMKQAVHAVVDDLARGHGDVVDAGEIVAVEPVVHGAVVRDQRLHPRRIEHMQAGDDVAVVAHFQDIGIAARQLRQHPAFIELIAGLIIVRPPQHRRECRAGGFRPDIVVVLLDQLDPQFADIPGNQRLACEVGMECRCVIVPDLEVALPGAGERLADDRIPAAAAGRHGSSSPSASRR